MINNNNLPDRCELNIKDLVQDKYKDKSKIALCRCWKSKKFPYCDGSHREYNQISGDNVGPAILTEIK